MAFVYVLRSGDEELFKIGRTRGDLQARIRQLATGNPHRLTLFDHIETEHEAVCETYLHRRLRSKRSGEGDAREFFALPAADLRDALRDAREFLAEFVPKQQEAERLAKEESDGVLLKPGDREWELYRRLLEIRENEDSLSLDRKLLDAVLVSISHWAACDRAGSSIVLRKLNVPFPCRHSFNLSPKGVAGMISTARIERPPLHRGGSASTDIVLATPHFILPMPR